MTAAEVHEAFGLLRKLTVADGHALVDLLERRLLVAEAMIELQDRRSKLLRIEDHPGFSVKVGA